jgi:methylated-DNA-[protein]-cysteine S-methyltransferase
MARRPRLCFRLDRIATPIGVALVVQDDERRLRALDWEDHEARMTRLLRLHYGEGAVELRAGNGSGAIPDALRDYLAGALDALDAVPVETGGTEFQRRVWRELRRIRAGTTLSYRQLARRVGSPDAVRAVGLANGANPVCVVVPCHRVVGSDGSLTGYAGGLDRKRWLLTHEGVAPHDNAAGCEAVMYA